MDIPLGKCILCRHGKVEFRTGSDHHEIRLSSSHTAENVCSAPEPIGRGIAIPVQRRDILAGKDECHGSCTFKRHPPGHYSLVGIAGTDDKEVGDRPECGKVFDRLMGWAIFPQPYAVMGENMDDMESHERRQP